MRVLQVTGLNIRWRIKIGTKRLVLPPRGLGVLLVLLDGKAQRRVHHRIGRLCFARKSANSRLHSFPMGGRQLKRGFDERGGRHFPIVPWPAWYNGGMESIIVCSKRKFARPVPLGYTRVDVDRKNPHLGNPFVLENANDSVARAKVIADFEAWFPKEMQKPQVANAIDQLAVRVAAGEKLALMCWCDPKPCHGHFLQRLINDRVQELTHGNNDGPGM